jgi:hypothetical protein
MTSASLGTSRFPLELEEPKSNVTIEANAVAVDMPLILAEGEGRLAMNLRRGPHRMSRLRCRLKRPEYGARTGD